MKRTIFFSLFFVFALSAVAQQNCHAVDDSITIYMNSPATIQVLANDSCQQACVNAYLYSQNGIVTVSSDGTYFTYTPNQGFTGTDWFQYYSHDCITGNQIDSAYVLVQVVHTIQCSVSQTQSASCGCTAMISLQYNSIFPPCTVSWNTGQTTDYIDGLCAGLYLYTITDSQGNHLSDSVIITADEFIVNSQVSNALTTNCNGSVYLAPSGGCPPYSYLWSNGQSTPVIDSLCPNNYSYTVTDSSGAVFTGVVTVFSTTQSAYCNNANPFCTGTTYDYPASTNSADAEPGPNYGCLFSQPNPAWYYMQVDQPGTIVIYMHSQPQVDIDFACWGPFSSPTAPCNGDLTASCTSCPNNTSDPGFYPSGNLTDCSYSTSWEETVHINNAQSGQYYIMLITNYSNNACNIIFDQTNAGQPGAGTASCDIFQVHVTGNVFNDLDNNQVKDSGEPGIQNAIIAVQNADIYYNSDSLGNYAAHMNNGNNVVAVPYISPYATINPASYTITQSEVNKNFAIYYTPDVTDLMVVLTNITAAIPGFPVNYELTYHNPGTVAQSGTVRLVKADELVFTGSNPAVTNISGDTLIWSFTGLQPMDLQNIMVQFTLPPAITLGTILYNDAYISPADNDFAPENNIDSLYQVVVGSYDPNLKEVEPAGDLYISEINQDMMMTYTIHFQNEGTANATTVRVEDIISEHLYMPSIQVISSSAPCELSVWGRKVNFTFNNINLPPKSVDEAGSQGFVKFGIQLADNPAPGTLVQNEAGIYFDFNAPVVTNTVNTLIKGIQTEIKNTVEGITGIIVSPNPNNGRARIYFNSKTNIATITISDISGRVMYEDRQVQNGSSLELPSLREGMYVLKCVTDGTSSESKLVIRK